MKQGEAIKRAGRVVRDNDQRAMLGDLLKVVGGEGAANAEMLKDLLDHIQPFKMAMAGGELLKFLFVKQTFKQVALPGGGPGLRPEVIKDAVETKHGGSSIRLRQTVEERDGVSVTGR